jgi:hypothetical protein
MDDATADLINRLAALELSFPPPAAMKATLSANPLVLPVVQTDLDSLSLELSSNGTTLKLWCGSANVKFEVKDAGIPTAFFAFLNSFNIKSISWTDSTEDEIHTWVETGVSAFFNNFCASTLKVGRNQKVETSAGRADFFLSNNGKQVLRGEDKLRSLAGSQNPERELVEKSPSAQEWKRFYGDAQYIFGYYCIGGGQEVALQFVCITCDGQVVKLTDRPFNLCTFPGMLGCRAFTASLCPFLLELAQSINVDVGWDWSMKRHSHHYPWFTCQVSIGLCAYAADSKTTCLLKEWGFKTRHPKAAHLLKCQQVRREECHAPGCVSLSLFLLCMRIHPKPQLPLSRRSCRGYCLSRST